MTMPALDTDLNQVKKLFDVKFWGVVAVARPFSPLVVAAGKGMIAKIASLAAVFHVPWMGQFLIFPCAILMNGKLTETL